MNLTPKYFLTRGNILPILRLTNTKQEDTGMRNEVKAVLARLRAIQIKVEEHLDQATDERAEALENELDCLTSAIESLEDID